MNGSSNGNNTENADVNKIEVSLDAKPIETVVSGQNATVEGAADSEVIKADNGEEKMEGDEEGADKKGEGGASPSYIDVDTIVCSDTEAGSPEVAEVKEDGKNDEAKGVNEEEEYKDDGMSVSEFMKSLGLSGLPDGLELDIVRLPSSDIVVAELADFRNRRVVSVFPARLTDMSFPGLQQLLRHEACIKFSAEYLRPARTTTADWAGKLNFGFETMDAAVKAAEGVKNVRDNLKVVVETETTPDALKSRKTDNRDWMDALLLVKNTGDQINTDKLKGIFPSADIFIRKQSKASDNINGQAYLMFTTAAQAQSVLSAASEKNYELDGRRLIMLKYEQSKASSLVPKGMLRLGERRLVLEEIRDMSLKIEKYGKKSWLTSKLDRYKDLERKDRAVRRQIGLCFPMLDQLVKTSNIRPFNDFEKKAILKRLLEPYEAEEKEKALVASASKTSKVQDSPATNKPSSNKLTPVGKSSGDVKRGVVDKNGAGSDSKKEKSTDWTLR